MDIVAAGNHVIHIACRAIGESSVVETVNFVGEFIRPRSARVDAVFDAAREVCRPSARRDELGVRNNLQMAAVDRALARDRVVIGGCTAVRELVVFHDISIRLKGICHILAGAGILVIIASRQGVFERFI